MKHIFGAFLSVVLLAMRGWEGASYGALVWALLWLDAQARATAKE